MAVVKAQAAAMQQNLPNVQAALAARILDVGYLPCPSQRAAAARRAVMPVAEPAVTPQAVAVAAAAARARI